MDGLMFDSRTRGDNKKLSTSLEMS